MDGATPEVDGASRDAGLTGGRIGAMVVAGCKGVGGALPRGVLEGRDRMGLRGAAVDRVGLSGANGSTGVLREGMEPATVLGEVGTLTDKGRGSWRRTGGS